MLRQIPLRPRSIWELEKSLYCPLVGSCLTSGDVRRLIAKMDPELGRHGSDYALHRQMVAVVEQPGPLRKWLQRRLEEKHRRHATPFLQTSAPERIRELWHKAAQEGHLDAAFWAVMSHPQLSDTLRNSLYGEFHILAHEAMHEKIALQRQQLHHEESLLVLRTRLQEEHQQRLKSQSELSGALSRNATLGQQVQLLEQKLLQLEATRTRQDHRAEVEALKEKILRLEQTLAHAQSSNLALRTELDPLRSALQSLRTDKAQQAQELAMLSQERGQLAEQLYLASPPCATEQGALCNAANCTESSCCLAGKCVLYVGGVTHMRQLYRSLVENQSGRFLYHDGGAGDGRQTLDQVMTKADAIFCPIECISHDACLRIKRFCQQNGRTFVPLRSPGLSSFARGLLSTFADPALVQVSD
ncbi:MAG: DUF2325 domain-containing protein [Magnetococcales bacterium]|nr:DUF2325 domain-containing protein [Magnetococcales bacterium]MBF0114510.1 DUF2325 domain-containing protein [Magnetococcales bacterium]